MLEKFNTFLENLKPYDAALIESLKLGIAVIFEHEELPVSADLTKAEEIVSSGDFFFHGTTSDKADTIRSNGLEPQHGDLVKSTEAYQGYEEQLEEDEEMDTPAVFFSKDLDWVMSKIRDAAGTQTPTPEDIMQYGALAIVQQNGNIYQSINGKILQPDGKIVPFERSELYIHPDFNSKGRKSLPPFIENTDFFSFKDAEVDVVLTGKDLFMFLKKHFKQN